MNVICNLCHGTKKMRKSIPVEISFGVVKDFQIDDFLSDVEIIEVPCEKCNGIGHYPQDAF